MKKLTIELPEIKQDLYIICQIINGLRNNANQYLNGKGLDVASKEIDPYYLFEGGATRGTQFYRDWKLAIKIAESGSLLKTIKNCVGEEGVNLNLCGSEVLTVTRAWHWIPGVVPPNDWTGTKLKKEGITDTLMLSFGCNSDGTIRQFWAAVDSLNNRADGKGDWNFSPDAKNSGFSTFTLTQEVYRRATYQQICGSALLDYGNNRDGDAKKGMKLKMENVP